jgi:hypothetical protein
VDSLPCSFEIDPGTRGEAKLDAASAVEELRAEHTPQLRQERAERRLGAWRQVVRPDGLDQLGPAALAVSVCRQVGEQQPALARRQVVFEPPALDLDHQPAAELDSVRQGRSKLIATRLSDNVVNDEGGGPWRS